MHRRFGRGVKGIALLRIRPEWSGKIEMALGQQFKLLVFRNGGRSNVIVVVAYCLANCTPSSSSIRMSSTLLYLQVEGMRIADYVRPETLLAEATKLGLQPDAQHPGRFRRPPVHMQQEMA